MGLFKSNRNQKMEIPCASCTRNICNLKNCHDFDQYEKYFEKEKKFLRKKLFVSMFTALFSLLAYVLLSKFESFVAFYANIN